MKLNFYLLFICSILCLLNSVVFAQSKAKVEDVDFYQSSNKEQIIITYDIVSAKPSETFQIDIEVKTLTGKSIEAKTLTGDIGAGIPGGKNKKIIWDVKHDKTAIFESIYIEVLATVEGESKNPNDASENKGWYMQFGYDANSPVNKSHFSEFDIWRYESTIYQTDPAISLGKGGGITYAIGYNLISQLGFEFRFMSNQGTTQKITSEENLTNYQGQYFNEISGNSLSFAPLAVINITRPNLFYYIKVGPMYSVARVNYGFTFDENDNGVQRYGNQQYILKGDITKGFCTELGITLRPTKVVSFSVGFNYRKWNFTPTKGELTEFYWNTAGEPYSKIEFVDQDTSLSDFGDTKQLYKRSHPFSGVGLNIAMTVNLK